MKTIAKTLSVSRSNLHERLSKNRHRRASQYIKHEDASLIEEITAICKDKPSYGYRRVHAILNRRRMAENQAALNHKRIYRLMSQNQLLLQRYTAKSTKTHDGNVVTLKSNSRWCSDTFTIRCFNHEKIEVTFCLDTCDREVISYVATTFPTTGETIRDLMLNAMESRFGTITRLPYQIEWLSDNGPPFTANETRLFGSLLGFEVCNTPSYSPESNGAAEAFVKTFKRDYVYLNRLDNPAMVLSQLPAWFEDYNENAPHKGLKMKSPREFRRLQLSA